MAFCKNCGVEIAGDQVVCDSCAEKFTAPKAAVTESSTPCTCQEDPAKKVVGIFTYIGLFILFAIPLIGFISTIIFSFAPKSKSLKNFSRAMLIWKIVGILIAVILASAILAIVAPIFEEALGFNPTVLKSIKMRDIVTITELTGYIESENYGAAIEMVKDGKLDEIIDRAKSGEFDVVIASIAGDDAGEILNALRSGELDAEIEKIKRGEYDSMIYGYFGSANIGSFSYSY